MATNITRINLLRPVAVGLLYNKIEKLTCYVNFFAVNPVVLR
jgi:hypothetical protein